MYKQIVEMKLITPAHGLITLSPTQNSALFYMSKVGLGSLGIVSELTLKCIPKMQLKEVSKVYDRQSIAKEGQDTASHYQRLLANRHVRYMWVPYTDTVVSVTSQLFEGNDEEKVAATSASTLSDSKSEIKCESKSQSGAPPQPNQHMLDLLQHSVERNHRRGRQCRCLSREERRRHWGRRPLWLSSGTFCWSLTPCL